MPTAYTAPRPVNTRDRDQLVSRRRKWRSSRKSTAPGEALAAGTVEVLGQLQYQDVVRQCVERLQAAIAQRNAALGQEFIGNPVPQPDVLARLVADITAEYLATGRLHGDGMTAENSAPAIELF